MRARDRQALGREPEIQFTTGATGMIVCVSLHKPLPKNPKMDQKNAGGTYIC